MNKYAVKTPEGVYLEKTPDDMHRRMAREFARIEEKYQKSDRPSKNLSEYGQKRSALDEKAIYQFFKEFKYVIPQGRDRKSTRLNSSHVAISYAVFCLKKKKKIKK